ncbi:MAG: hypothetical protein ABIQ12_05515 [Opitutaceae bacterium]
MKTNIGLSNRTKSARTSANPGIGLAADDVLSELLDLREELMVRLPSDSKACAGKFMDAGTADFPTGLMTRHEKDAWMIRSQLETEEVKAS